MPTRKSSKKSRPAARKGRRVSRRAATRKTSEQRKTGAARKPWISDLPPEDVLARHPVPELYFATVRALGTPIGVPAVKPLTDTLQRVAFDLCEIKLSQRLFESDAKHALDELGRKLPSPTATPLERYRALMNCGEALRIVKEDGGALAIEAIRHLHDVARPSARDAAADRRTLGVAYLFRNLMHPAEVQRLRKLYDRQLFVISIFSPEEKRVAHLAENLASTTGRASEYMSDARGLIDRESGRSISVPGLEKHRALNSKFVLNIEQTFQYADLFVDASDAGRSRDQVKRFVELIFRHPFHTPTVEEIGMADAFSAALESGNLARQVGAAICSPDGDLLVTGTNDVPQPGGGVYRSGANPDGRDYSKDSRWGYDPSDRHRRQILANFMRHLLADPKWLQTLELKDRRGSPSDVAGELARTLEAPIKGVIPDGPSPDEPVEMAQHAFVDYEALVRAIIQSRVIWQSEFFDVIEYGRTLHAEMDAITSAARKGLSIKGCTLYCTTLPCHECARLIIGSGLRRVVFIEPYEKSRAYELYRTEIGFTTLEESVRAPERGKVDFVPYVGISPLRFQELFRTVPRKRSDDVDWFGDLDVARDLSGDVVDWDRQLEKLSTHSNDIHAETYKTEPPIVRESIVSPSSFLSTARFRHLYDHESRMLNDYYNV